jgi:ribosomal protein S18 acetylase RimI-like enzyme
VGAANDEATPVASGRTVPSSDVKVRGPADRGLSRRVRVRSSAFDPGVLHLALADQGIVPDADELATWIDALAGRRGVHAIRTGALFAAAADRFADAGFSVVDTLMLLRADLSDPRVERHRPGARATRPLRARQHGAAAEIDRAAFGAEWGNGAGDLAEIRRATTSHRARLRRATSPASGHRPLRRPRIVAFAITGAAGGQGYLQRLAVEPGHQRQGHGRALTVDSLTWMRRRRLSHAVVNTGIDNEAARALYESLGFRAVPERLVVMQLDLARGG